MANVPRSDRPPRAAKSFVPDVGSMTIAAFPAPLSLDSQYQFICRWLSALVAWLAYEGPTKPNLANFLLPLRQSNDLPRPDSAASHFSSALVWFKDFNAALLCTAIDPTGSSPAPST